MIRGSRENLAWALHETARRQPRALAVHDERQHDYGTLAEAAAGVAGWLAREGLGPGTRVAVLARRGFDAFAGILGALWAGAAYVPLSPGTPAARNARILARARPDALVVDAAGALALGAVERPVLDLGAASGAAPLEEPVPLAEDAAAYLLFTSGSTGDPKGVLVGAAAVRHFLRAMQRRYEFTPDDRTSQTFELTFDLSVFDLLMAFGAGASLHVVPDSARMAPVDFVRERRLTTWFSVPSTVACLRRLRALAPESLPSLRLSLFCGEALPAEAVRAWRAAAPASKIENLYGPTEATIACLLEPCPDELCVTPGRGTVAIGRPLPGMHAAVVDAGGRFLGAGERGELALAGPQLALAYWGDPELTAERFPTLEHREHGRARWYRTGDHAYADAEGRFHHLGRLDNQVKVRGHRVELEEVDAALRAAGAGEAAAVAWPVVDGLAEGLVAFVSGVGNARELSRRLRRQLPAPLVPRRIVELDSLPRSAAGKVDRRALVARLEEEGRAHGRGSAA